MPERLSFLGWVFEGIWCVLNREETSDISDVVFQPTLQWICQNSGRSTGSWIKSLCRLHLNWTSSIWFAWKSNCGKICIHNYQLIWLGPWASHFELKVWLIFSENMKCCIDDTVWSIKLIPCANQRSDSIQKCRLTGIGIVVIDFMTVLTPLCW